MHKRSLHLVHDDPRLLLPAPCSILPATPSRRSTHVFCVLFGCRGMRTREAPPSPLDVTACTWLIHRASSREASCRFGVHQQVRTTYLLISLARYPGHLAGSRRRVFQFNGLLADGGIPVSLGLQTAVVSENYLYGTQRTKVYKITCAETAVRSETKYSHNQVWFVPHRRGHDRIQWDGSEPLPAALLFLPHEDIHSQDSGGMRSSNSTHRRDVSVGKQDGRFTSCSEVARVRNSRA